eukprot:gene13745-19647_t
MAEVQVSPIISLPHTLTALANSSRAGALPINLLNVNGGGDVTTDLGSILDILQADESDGMMLGRNSLANAVDTLAGVDMDEIDLQLLATELAALLDSPTSGLATSQGKHPHPQSVRSTTATFTVFGIPSFGSSHPPSGYGPQGGGQDGPPSTDVAKLWKDLGQSRHVASELAAHAKTCEAVLAGLRQSVPMWMQLRKAQYRAKLRRETSLMRSQLEHSYQEMEAELDEAKELLERIKADGDASTQPSASLHSFQVGQPFLTEHYNPSYHPSMHPPSHASGYPYMHPPPSQATRSPPLASRATGGSRISGVPASERPATTRRPSEAVTRASGVSRQEAIGIINGPPPSQVHTDELHQAVNSFLSGHAPPGQMNDPYASHQPSSNGRRPSSLEMVEPFEHGGARMVPDPSAPYPSSLPRISDVGSLTHSALNMPVGPRLRKSVSASDLATMNRKSGSGRSDLGSLRLTPPRAGSSQDVPTSYRPSNLLSRANSLQSHPSSSRPVSAMPSYAPSSHGSLLPSYMPSREPSPIPSFNVPSYAPSPSPTPSRLPSYNPTPLTSRRGTPVASLTHSPIPSRSHSPIPSRRASHSSSRHSPELYVKEGTLSGMRSNLSMPDLLAEASNLSAPQRSAPASSRRPSASGTWLPPGPSITEVPHSVVLTPVFAGPPPRVHGCPQDHPSQAPAGRRHCLVLGKRHWRPHLLLTPPIIQLSRETQRSSLNFHRLAQTSPTLASISEAGTAEAAGLMSAYMADMRRRDDQAMQGSYDGQEYNQPGNGISEAGTRDNAGLMSAYMANLRRRDDQAMQGSYDVQEYNLGGPEHSEGDGLTAINHELSLKPQSWAGLHNMVTDVDNLTAANAVLLDERDTLASTLAEERERFANIIKDEGERLTSLVHTSHQRLHSLAHATAALLQLPPDLTRALLAESEQPGASHSRPPPAAPEPHQSTVGQLGAGTAPHGDAARGNSASTLQPEGQHAMPFNDVLFHLRDYIMLYLQHVHDTACAGTEAELRHREIIPLLAQNTQLTEDLRDSKQECKELKTDLYELQQTLSEMVPAWEKSAEEARQQYSSAAGNAMESVLSTLRVEVHDMQQYSSAAGNAMESVLSTLRVEVHDMQEQVGSFKSSARSALTSSGQAWRQHLASVTRAADNAVLSLDKATTQLQEELAVEKKVSESTKEELKKTNEEHTKSAATAASSIRSQTGKVGSLTQRIESMEAEETRREEEMRQVQRKVREQTLTIQRLEVALVSARNAQRAPPASSPDMSDSEV